MVHLTHDRSIIPGCIYRHFKGNLFQIVCVAHPEDYPEKECVVYRDLNDFTSCWIRDAEEFLSLVEPGKENPTGQKYRFMRVTSFDNQLSMASTVSLIEELMSREDNPFRECMMKDSPKVLDSYYSLGRIDDFTEPGKVMFNPVHWCKSIEEARDMKDKTPTLSVVHTTSVIVEDLK